MAWSTPATGERRASEGTSERPVAQAVLLACEEHASAEEFASAERPSTSDRTVLDRMVRACRRAGVAEVIVVVGPGRARLLPELARLRVQHQMRVLPIVAEHWRRGSGALALAADRCVRGRFLLLSVNRFVDPSILQCATEMPPSTAACTVVVERTAEGADCADGALRVRIDGTRVIGIGQGLPEYDGIAPGLFVCDPRFFEALYQAERAGLHDLIDAVQELADGHEVNWLDAARAA